jgi:hypothetical protein
LINIVPKSHHITATTTDLGIGLNGKLVLYLASIGISDRWFCANPKPAVVPRRWATATSNREKNRQHLFLKKETYIFTENIRLVKNGL